LEIREKLDRPMWQVDPAKFAVVLRASPGALAFPFHLAEGEPARLAAELGILRSGRQWREVFSILADELA